MLKYFEELREQHREVSNKGRTLSDSCEKLVSSRRYAAQTQVVGVLAPI